MSERSLRIPPGTPPDMVIAAFNGLADRVDAIEAKREPVSRYPQCDGSCAHDFRNPVNETIGFTPTHRNLPEVSVAEHQAKFAALRADVALWSLSWDGSRFRVTDGIVHAESDVLAVPFTMQHTVDTINRLVRGMRLTMAMITAIETDESTASPEPTAHVMDAHHHDDERVMVRAVSPGHVGPDDEWDTWVLDPDATGHRAPFTPGDLVADSNGREGFHRVLAVWMDDDAPRHRRLCLKVMFTDVVVDRDAF